MIAKLKDPILITGASSGIGYELANIFAKKGFSLILVARNKNKLETVTENLKKQYNVKIKMIIQDLSSEYASEKIFDQIKKENIEVNTLINNAGLGYCGLFPNMPSEKVSEIIKVNIQSLTKLTRLFSEDMISRGHGNILNIASTGAYQPGPYISVYYASKAYVLSFSYALRNELKEYGINVSVLCPGATKTGFSKNAGKADIKNSMSARKVAKIAYKGIKKNKGLIVPGVFNKTAIVFSKIAPAWISGNIVRKIQKNVISKFNVI
jgi:uncharacterized protein